MSAAAKPMFAPLQGIERALGTLALAISTFMYVLDSSIANVSLPAIAGDLGVSPAQGTWVITSFAVANGIAVPLTGWLTQRFGAVRLFTACVLLFVLTSWVCGLAPTLDTLIAARILQGLVAGPLIPLSQALLLASYPPALAGTALAFWSMTILVAPITGPLLGGWITDNISWPWIFYINVPIGIFSAMLVWSVYGHRDPGPRPIPVDIPGLCMLIVWIGALQLTVDLGKEYDWFASPLIQGLAVTALVVFLFFLAWELTDRHPIVNLRLFASRNFMIGSLTLSLGYGVFFANVVLVPLWVQQWMGYTATWAGWLTAPVGILAILLTPWVGRNTSRIDARLLSTVAFSMFAFVMWLRSNFSTDSPYEVMLIPTVLQGIAMAFFFIPLQTLLFRGLPPHLLPSAAGLSNFVRITAGGVATSIFTTFWERRTAFHHARLTETIHLGNEGLPPTLAMLDGRGLSPDQASATINRLIDQQAATMAVTDLFWVSTLIFAALIGVVWSTRPR